MVVAKTEGVARNAAGQVEGYEIFIKYLPNSTTEDSLAAFFAEAGPAVGALPTAAARPPRRAAARTLGASGAQARLG